MRILSCDLGTNTGWAIGQDGKLVDCGTWKLATAKEIALAGKNRMSRRLDPRIPKLWRELDRVNSYAGIDWPHLDWIVYEDVTFSSTTYQTQLWASFRTVVWLFAHSHGIQTECLGVKQLKKFATGNGGATKELMSAHLITGSEPRIFLDCKSSMPQFHGPDGTKILDDNAADAVHLLHWAMKTLKNT